MYIDKIVRSEADSQQFTYHNERPVEFSFALRAIAEHQPKPKSVCDIGTGTTAFPHLLRNCGMVVTAVDNVRDYWPAGMQNRHWPVLDVDVTNLNGFANRRFDAVTCISVLEHIKDQQKAVANMAGLLNAGGLLIITTPFSAYNPCENVYLRPDALYGKDLPYPCRSHSESELEGWKSLGLNLLRSEYWKMFTGPVWATGQRTEWTKAEDTKQPHQLGCFAFVRH
jgi:2-polyprenyl-3-methyl-5-hydroxy-6-metoxy-1,4-benzoquinol methylase